MSKKHCTTKPTVYRRLLWVLCVCSFMFFLLACSDEPVQQTQTKEDSQPETVTLEFWNTMDYLESQAFSEIIQQFEFENPSIKIIEKNLDFFEAQKEFRDAADTEDSPDLFRADRFWLADFAKDDLILNIAEIKITEALSDMIPIAKDIIQFDNKYWAIPLSLDSLALFYNRTHLEKKNLLPPVDFDDFAKVATSLTDTISGIYAFFINPEPWYIEPFLFGFGGGYITEESAIKLNSNHNRKAFEYLLHLKNRLQVFFPIAYHPHLYQTMIENFGNGSVSMIFAGPWSIREIISKPEFKSDNSNLGIVQVPAGILGSYSPVGCKAIVISKKTKYPKEALRFALYLFSFETQKKLASVNFSLPARESVYDADEIKRDPYLQIFINQLRTHRQNQKIMRSDFMYKPLSDTIKDILYLEQDVADSLEALQSSLEELH